MARRYWLLAGRDRLEKRLNYARQVYSPEQLQHRFRLALLMELLLGVAVAAIGATDVVVVVFAVIVVLGVALSVIAMVALAAWFVQAVADDAVAAPAPPM